MVMKTADKVQREFRVIAAGVFKATCLQLLDEVHKNRNLSIIVTKRGKPIGQLIGPPEGIRLTGPTVVAEDISPERRKITRRSTSNKLSFCLLTPRLQWN
jgi:hypothetical protein